MQITRLQIKNFLSISDVELIPGQVTQIVGGNNQGKSTILRALEVALKGSPDGSLVKRGEDAAEIVVEFDDLQVRRRIRADGKQDVTVKRGEFKADSPQSLLNTFLDGSAFNPLELLDPKSREEAILRAVELRVTPEDIAAALEGIGLEGVIPPVSYDQHGLKVVEQVHKYFYQRRAEANKAAKEREEVYRVKQKELPQPPAKDRDMRSDDEIRAAITGIQNEIASEHQKVAKLKELEARKEKAKEVIDARTEQLNELKTQLKTLEVQIANREELLKADHTAFLGLAAEAEAMKPDFSQIQHKNNEINSLAGVLKTRELGRYHERLVADVEGLRLQAEKAREFAARLDMAVQNLGDKFQEDLMKRCNFPVEGLVYQNGRFFLDGSSIDNLSTSASIRLAVALARKLGAKTKLICLDGAEALDETSYQLLSEQIKGDGYTYFITKVGEPFPSAGDSVVRMVEGRAVVAAQPA